MKKVILLSVMALSLVSCMKEYTHKKLVTNNTDSTIEVISGCCGQEDSYTIEPRTTEVVFDCIYQQKNRPTTDEMSWDFTVIDKDGNVSYLNNPDQWVSHEKGTEISYTYTVE